MRAYESPTALRSALEHRLANRSRETGTDLDRLRRRAAFERLLVRLELGAPGRWIVKGGMALEVRLGDRARSTRDLDLALRGDAADGAAVRELLIDCLAPDVEGDGFAFRVGTPSPITPHEAGRPGWRFSVEARMAGRTFANVRPEVVARADEIATTQRVELPGVLAFAGLARHEVEVVDPAQHFAEKLHALTRSYGARPNTRVRDLADLVLLIDDGLEPSPALLAVVAHVFAVRATHELPATIPDTPASWDETYSRLAASLDLSATTRDEAVLVVRSFWADLRTHRVKET